MKIGLDIDGVIYDWHHVVYRMYKLHANYDKSYRKFWMEYIPSLDKSTQDYIVSIPLFYDMSMPTVDARDTLPKLAELGELFYITNRNESLKFVTSKFFNKNNLPDSQNLFMVEDKTAVVRLYDIDVFLDDKVEIVNSLRNICTSFLMRKVWNEEYQDQFPTVSSLAEFYNILTR